MRPIILYFTAEYPDKKTFSDFLGAVDPDIVKYVEIGIPTVNPLYDGPAIKATHTVTRDQFEPGSLACYTGILGEMGIDTVALGYREVFGTDVKEFAEYLKESGISGAIVPDLLIDHFEERDLFIEQLQSRVPFVPFFNPATPDSVIKEISAITNSWIYYGLQPSTGINVPYDPVEVSARILNLVREREVNFGFGVRTVSDVGNILALGSSGVAIGSLLVPILKDRNVESFRNFQDTLKEEINRAK